MIIILILYVDDLFITKNDEQVITQLKFQLMAQFRMTNSSPMQKYLSVEFKCTIEVINIL
jgi:hypothetical protein